THVENLYQFLVQNRVQEKLEAYEKQFTEQGDLVRAKEYGQIYRLVIELLDQIYGLLGEEQISLQEFLDILVAGFGEIEVGTIPQNVDRILVGDMERTRLKQVKVLFFLGVNDGNIPRSASKGGIISDMDREFLKESDLELAPTPRQQMFIQRFYLYLNLTKPSDRLYLSYAKVNGAGKTMRPSYLIETIRKMYPDLTIEQPFRKPVLEQLVTPKEGVRYLAQSLREYVENVPGILSKQELFAIYQTYEGMEDYEGLVKTLKEAAFYRYEASGLSAVVARALYGQKLENSVSRLETYAACAYHHFLQYGLSLKEREEFGFEAVDMGNIFHGVLDEFARRLEDSEYTWFNFPQEFGQSQVAEAMEQVAAEYGAGILYSSARQAYGINRMQRILNRTVDTLQKQLQKGEFVPMGHEISFRYVEDLAAVDVTLSQEEKMRLTGRIDRVDVAEDEDQVYVKVINYKSGTHQFQLASVYYGLQLQLVVYMNAAMELEAEKHPRKEVVPAALLYYHIADPVVETPVEL
ncbi:MAG: PD-(D/E)XK nuclease family protein, partial [Lachnospiraceae bacterium]|nr:PD-(D/E)XK nuclease family protein [Lachnospiraceae bacterium]